MGLWDLESLRPIGITYLGLFPCFQIAISNIDGKFGSYIHFQQNHTVNNKQSYNCSKLSTSLTG